MAGPRRVSSSPMVFVAGVHDEQGQALRSAPAYDVETEGTGVTAGHGAPPAEVQRDLRRRLIRRFRWPSKVRGVRRHGWPMDNEAYGEIHDKL